MKLGEEGEGKSISLSIVKNDLCNVYAMSDLIHSITLPHSQSMQSVNKNVYS